jgi:hypothetical protein
LSEYRLFFSAKDLNCHAGNHPLRAMKISALSRAAAWVISVNLLGGAMASAQVTELIWDANAATEPNPSDGGATWMTGSRWWNGSTNVAWNNTTHANTVAVLGSGGASGTVNFAGGVSAGGLRFQAVADGKGYQLGGGTLTLADGAFIDLRTGSSGNVAGDRLRFTSTSIIAGSNITISNNVDGGTFANYVTMNGANTWTGTLNLRGNGTGLFMDVVSPNSLATLTTVDIRENATLAPTTGTYSGPTLQIAGTGLSGRGAIRFDNGVVNLNSNVVLTADARISTNTAGTGVFNGVVSGDFTLTVNSDTDSVNRIVLKNNNTFTRLSISRGNVQIGEGGVGTSGAGLTTLNAGAISGTGQIKGGFQVFGGSINPGDNGGQDIGTLNVTGNLNLLSIATEQTVMNFTLGAGGASDRINVTNNVLLRATGNLSVLFESGYTPTVGDSWTLLDWGGALNLGDFSLGENLRTGADADGNEGDLLLDDLSPYGYQWNIGTDTGALVVSIVPEPSVALLSVLAAAGFASRRRRTQA